MLMPMLDWLIMSIYECVFVCVHHHHQKRDATTPHTATCICIRLCFTPPPPLNSPSNLHGRAAAPNAAMRSQFPHPHARVSAKLFYFDSHKFRARLRERVRSRACTQQHEQNGRALQLWRRRRPTILGRHNNNPYPHIAQCYIVYV